MSLLATLYAAQPGGGGGGGGGGAAGNPLGTINQPVQKLGTDPVAGIGKMLSLGVQLVMVVAALTVLAYMLWGAYDWITSGGEKDKLSKAQQKITNAVVGILVLVIAFAIFGVLTGNILNIITFSGGSFSINIPTIGP